MQNLIISFLWYVIVYFVKVKNLPYFRNNQSDLIV